MSINIGEIIKKQVKSKGISVTDFAEKINYSRRNIYEIFEKKTIDTGILVKINKVLGANLFMHYLSEEEITDFKSKKMKSEDVLIAIKDLKDTVIALHEKHVESTKTKSFSKKIK